MRKLAILLLAPALALGGDTNGGELNWLAGCWVTPDHKTQEVWVVDDERSLMGFAVSINDDKVGFYEILRIELDSSDKWVYKAHPSGQAPASFVAVQISKYSVVFANPDHDYPQEIRYRREGDRLYASVSLLGGDNPNSFDKVACESGLR